MSTCEAYAGIPRAQLTYDYLHTNSTTHEFLFGALAELVDNARDAASKRIDIYSEPAESYRGKYMLCFLDDGDGMDPDEVNNVIKFGRSDKRIIDKNMIGQYGNGLKSGTMRIAKDMILFTKKENKLSCLMISRTFHEREEIQEILIPMPNWDGRTKKPLYRMKRDAQQHKTEVDIITKYSPFKTTESLLAQFDKIKATGTLVILFNLQLMDNGKPELDVTTDPYDILMGDPYAGESYGDDHSVVPERKSFRAYTAVLYLDPKMKIYIQNKKVRTVRLATSLYKPAVYTFTSKRFKCRLEKEEKKAEQELRIAEAKAKELEMQEREEREKAESETSKDAFTQHRQAGDRLASARADVNIKKMTYENTKKALKEPQTLDFIFGINLNKRQCCGVMVYNCNRLIKMYQKVGCQTDGGVQGFGVMGIVNVPYLVLEPTHNKQDFADGKEYKALTKALGEHLDDYWKNCPIAKQVVRFWDSYGYNSSDWKAGPSNEDRYVRKRMMELPLYVQCDRCLKWRKLDFHSKYIKDEIQADWCCKMNPDTDCNNCQRPEKKPAPMAVRTLNKSKQQRAATTSTTTPAASTRESRQANDSRVQGVQRETRRQPTPPKEPPRPVAQRAIRPAPPQQRAVVTTPSSSVPIRPKPQTTSSKKQEQRSTPSPKPAITRQIKQEKPPAQQRKPGRPKADSTEDKREPKMKRPHPDNNNAKRTKESVKRRKSDVIPSPVNSEPEVDSNDNEMDWTSDREAEASRSPAKQEPTKLSDHDIVSLQGGACKAKAEDGKWYAGTITCVKQMGEGIRAKVKFAQYQNNKFDKWYDYPGSDIRLEVTTSEPVLTPPSPVNHPSPQPSTVELPSTTTSEQPTAVSLPSSPVASPDNTVSSLADSQDHIVSLTRKLLEFFVPPHYHLTKEQLRSLSIDELRNFDVSEFCKKYEDDLGQLMSGVTAKGDKALEELKEKYDDVVAQRTQQATTIAQKTEELARVTQQCEQHKISLHQKTGELSRVTSLRDNMSVALKQKSDELTRVTQREQLTADLLLQRTQELSRVTQQLTSLRGKTAQLIGMLNEGAEEMVSEDTVETYIDNYITLLQNEVAHN